MRAGLILSGDEKNCENAGSCATADPEVSKVMITRMYNLIFILLKAVLKESQISGIFKGKIGLKLTAWLISDIGGDLRMIVGLYQMVFKFEGIGENIKCGTIANMLMIFLKNKIPSWFPQIYP